MRGLRRAPARNTVQGYSNGTLTQSRIGPHGALNWFRSKAIVRFARHVIPLALNLPSATGA
jgi:hypothetical protein